MFNINNHDNRTIQIVLSEEELEEAFRTVLAQMLDEREEKKREPKLTKAAVRKRLCVDDSTLWRWDKSGYLKAIRIGRHVYYRESDVIDIEEGRI